MSSNPPLEPLTGFPARLPLAAPLMRLVQVKIPAILPRQRDPVLAAGTTGNAKKSSPFSVDLSPFFQGKTVNLSLRQLRVFLGVAETSSFTKTAQRLHLSQAALSAVIRELETQLQCRLLDRTTRSVSLTEAGRLFLPTATHVVQVLENAAQELARIGRAGRLLMRIGVTPNIAVSIIPAVLKRFSQLQPEVRVEITDTRPADLLRMVEAGELDAAFGAFFNKASGIDRIPVFPSELVVASSTAEDGARPKAGSSGLSWASLQDVPLICFPSDNPIQRLVEENLAKERVTTGKRMVVGHLETAIAMAEAGFGVAIVPSISAATCQRFKVQLAPLHPSVEVPFFCITRSGRGDLTVLEQFSRLVAEVADEFARDGKPGRTARQREKRVP